MPENSALTVHGLKNQPVHLYQLNNDPKTYNNPMGCGAFSTAMALSCYNPQHYGAYNMAKDFFQRMLHVPLVGGTFESQNAHIAKLEGFKATSFDHGKIGDLTAAIDVNAPVVLLINPTYLGIGTHDVLLVGYGTDTAGAPQAVFIDNPAHQENNQPGTNYPGNQTIAASDLPQRWTGVFTPIFSSDAQQADWLHRANRKLPELGLGNILSKF